MPHYLRITRAALADLKRAEASPGYIRQAESPKIEVEAELERAGADDV